MKLTRFMRYVHLFYFLVLSNLKEDLTEKIPGICSYDSKNEPVCCDAFTKVPGGECWPCVKNKYSDNCTICRNPWYGFHCRLVCDCLPSLCHPYRGCLNATNNENSTSLSNTSYTSKSTIEYVKSDHPAVIILSSEGTLYTRLATSPVPPEDKESPTNLVIIITGSILGFFLVIIIINQFHGKFKKRQGEVVNRRLDVKLPNVEEYHLIDDVVFTSTAYNYDQMKNKYLDKNKGIENRSQYNEIEETQSRPRLPMRPSKTNLENINVTPTIDVSDTIQPTLAGTSHLVAVCLEEYEDPDTITDSEGQKQNIEDIEHLTTQALKHHNVVHAEGIYDKEAKQHKYDYPDFTSINSPGDPYLTPRKLIHPNTYIEVIESTRDNVTTIETRQHPSLTNTDSNPVDQSNKDNQQNTPTKRISTLPYDDFIEIQKNTDPNDDSQSREHDPTYLDVVDN